MLANHVFRRLMHFFTPLLLLLQPSVQWLSIVNFNNNAKPPPKWILRQFDVSRIRPRPGGSPTCHVNVIKLIWKVMWTGRLPHLSELPHLTGVPHIHVNRPLDYEEPDYPIQLSNYVVVSKVAWIVFQIFNRQDAYNMRTLIMQTFFENPSKKKKSKIYTNK